MMGVIINRPFCTTAFGSRKLRIKFVVDFDYFLDFSFASLTCNRKRLKTRNFLNKAIHLLNDFTAIECANNKSAPLIFFVVECGNWFASGPSKKSVLTDTSPPSSNLA